MKTKHTPGPWRFDGHGINNVKGKRIAKVCHYKPYIFPDGKPIRNICFDKDSQLIAAAPELLEACKGAIAALSQNKTFQADIDCAKSYLKYAINKAEGE